MLDKVLSNFWCTFIAFAALKGDKSVVTWGSEYYGGLQRYYSDSLDDYVDVSSSLTSGVTNIFSTKTAFAALKSDGSVVIWGDAGSGGTTTGEVSSFISSGVEKIIILTVLMLL